MGAHRGYLSFTGLAIAAVLISPAATPLSHAHNTAHGAKRAAAPRAAADSGCPITRICGMARVGDGGSLRPASYTPAPADFALADLTTTERAGDLASPLSLPVVSHLGLAAPAPEPVTWAMILVGVGMAGGAMRRSRGAGVGPGQGPLAVA